MSTVPSSLSVSRNTENVGCIPGSLELIQTLRAVAVHLLNISPYAESIVFGTRDTGRTGMKLYRDMVLKACLFCE
jgi:hypothetical protein